MITGGALALGQAPFSLWFVALIGLLASFALFRAAQTVRHAALLGWGLGTGYFAGSMYWILAPFQVDAARDGWMAPFALVFLSAGLALLWGAGFAWARWAGGARASGLMLALGWGAAELLRGYLFTGLPWGLLGYIWVETPVAQLASTVGSYGLTFLTFLCVGALFLNEKTHRRFGIAVFGALGVAAWGAGVWMLSQPTNLSADQAAERAYVRLVQPNAAQHKKWDAEYIPFFFDQNLEFTAAPAEHPLDLTVWPETALPYLLEEDQPALKVVARAAGGVPVALGGQRLDLADRAYNSLALLGPSGDLQDIYDKSHLVPFGEYMPGGALAQKLGLRGLAAQLSGGYRAGDGPRLMHFAGQGETAAEATRRFHFLPLICYEAVFPRSLHQNGMRADWILHITNDAWFGKRAGPYQHLIQTQMRAIEQRVSVVRAANTGVSAVISPRGEIMAQIPLGEAGWIDAPVPLAQPKGLYARVGDGPLIIFFIGFMLWRSRSRAKQFTLTPK
jgi:apolipoprotein N-acyltransferase